MRFVKDEIQIAIIGLGYVGLPLAIAFREKFKVIAYDLNKKRIDDLRRGFDVTNEVDKGKLIPHKNIHFTSLPKNLKNANIYIITVPTPVDKNNTPNLLPLKNASSIVAKYLDKNDFVIYESTVFPGCTEEVCVPILEKKSGLVYNIDFFCGYSPERINPGDKENVLSSIVKVTSGSNHDAAIFVDKLYNNIIKAGTYRASSIAVAEAAKVIENTQRDGNIALVNELSLIFNRLNIDTAEVLDAASTKWNFMSFKPGLVGGHCIGVDPYYLTYRAAEVGYHPEVILAGRRVNDNMGIYIAEKTITELTKLSISPIGAKIAVLGLTFKSNCPDLRNTKVFSIIDSLQKYNCSLIVSDVHANKNEAKELFNIDLQEHSSIKSQDAIIVAVDHDEYKSFNKEHWDKMLKPNGLLIDVKSIYSISDIKKLNIVYWRL